METNQKKKIGTNAIDSGEDLVLPKCNIIVHKIVL